MKALMKSSSRNCSNEEEKNWGRSRSYDCIGKRAEHRSSAPKLNRVHLTRVLEHVKVKATTPHPSISNPSYHTTNTMLALQPPSSQRKLTPNLLPCSIKHNGPVPIHPRYWSPTKPSGVTKTSTSYLRGRLLRGRHVALPAGYTGVVLQNSSATLPSAKADGNGGLTCAGAGVSMVDRLRAMEGEGVEDEEDEDGEGPELEEVMAVKLLEEKGRFEEVVVWGHEAVVEADDEFVRGVEEWVGFAQAMHEYSTASEMAVKEAA